METPVHIDFQGMEPKEKPHAAVARLSGTISPLDN
jgi:hypothetical protein